MVRVKICGITNVEDALLAVKEGADAIGFVFAASPRRISEERAKSIREQLPPFVTVVGIFVDPDPSWVSEVFERVGLNFVQLYGADERQFISQSGLNLQRLIYSVSVGCETDLEQIREISAGVVHLDTKVSGKAGGTGKTFDWRLALKAKSFGKRIVLSGGLNPGNVAEAVKIALPDAVDVSSGVESEPGRKDPIKVREFIRRAKGYAT